MTLMDQTAKGADRHMLKASDQALNTSYRLALLDLDGVVYRGKQPVGYAARSIHEAQALGMTVEYTTNNSSRFQHVVAQQLQGFDLDVQPWQIITSSVVAARMVRRELAGGAKVLVIGAEHLRQEVAAQGLELVQSAQDGPEAVIQGWYPDISWRELAEASYAVERGAFYFITNRDLTIPRELGIAPGCGAMVEAVIRATGVEPMSSAGKPEPAMYDEARSLAARDGREPMAKESCLAIGDRLDTDIEAGNRGGYDSLAVLTGVTNPRELMLAPRIRRPTFIVEDLRGLGDAQPVPTRLSSDRWECGGAEAHLDNERIFVSDTRDINALRAACALAWQSADDGIDAAVFELPTFDLANSQHDDG